jgi:hypothetical protein
LADFFVKYLSKIIEERHYFRDSGMVKYWRLEGRENDFSDAK